MTNGKRNRSAGHGWETEVVRILRDRKIYPKAITTRNGSRVLDALGIDAMNEGEETHGIMDDTVQCKNTIGGVNYHELISGMQKAGRPHPVVFHKRTSRREANVVLKGHYCTTTMATYLELMAYKQAIKRIMAVGRSVNADAIVHILNDLNL